MTPVDMRAVRGATDLATLRATLQLQPTQSLVFVAADGEREFAVDSDLALRVAANIAGHVVVADTSAEQPPSVATALRNVVAALVHTASRPPSPPLVAALLRSNAPAASSFAPPSPPAPNPRSPSPMTISPGPSSPGSTTPPQMNGRNSPGSNMLPLHMNRSPKLKIRTSSTTQGVSTSSGSITPPLTIRPTTHRLTHSPPTRTRSPPRSSSPRSAEHRFADACFCTHWGVCCASCTTTPIRGVRYECGVDSLCERCRRDTSRVTSLTVYEHPWESDATYQEARAEDLRAPPAPLEIGDRGPRVVHLHYVLYTLGYLFLLSPGFEHDSFTDVTKQAVARFQTDHMEEDEDGAYRARTRAAVLERAEIMERVRATRTCRSNTASRTTENPRMRLRSALAA